MNSGLKPKMMFYMVALSEFATIPILVVIAFVLKNSDMPLKQNMDPSTLKILLYALVTVSIFEFFFMIFFNNKINSSREKGELTTRKELSFRIILMALGIAPAIYGFLLFLLSQDMNYLYIFCCVSMLLYGIFFPKGEFLEESA